MEVCGAELSRKLLELSRVEESVQRRESRVFEEPTDCIGHEAKAVGFRAGGSRLSDPCRGRVVRV
uniref:Uncharacterized protein n=1 Tax=Picea sitchensis TaxID=3332 RepID=D5AAL8_PICSI|nr:unknown [Picea sitchensis]